MHQGNWKCSGCGGTITELPFIPRSESGLTCRTCYGKHRDNKASVPQPPEMSSASEAFDIPFDAELASGPMPADDFAASMPAASSERPKFSGNWQCASCGSAITSLPFTPRDTSNLKCLDCFKKSKG